MFKKAHFIFEKIKENEEKYKLIKFDNFSDDLQRSIKRVFKILENKHDFTEQVLLTSKFLDVLLNEEKVKRLEQKFKDLNNMDLIVLGVRSK